MTVGSSSSPGSSGLNSLSPTSSEQKSKSRFKLLRIFLRRGSSSLDNGKRRGSVEVPRSEPATRKRRPHSMYEASSSSTGGCRACCSCRKKTGKKKRKSSSCQCNCYCSKAAAIEGRFPDEDDLYVEIDKAVAANKSCHQKSGSSDLEYEDAGVCLASVSSSSPASSQKGQQQQKPAASSTPESVRRKQSLQIRASASTSSACSVARPSCSFGGPTSSGPSDLTSSTKMEGLDGLMSPPPGVQGPPSTCSSSVMSLLPLPDETCPSCGFHYDRKSKRKLIDSECGHGKCYECMFSTSICMICNQSQPLITQTSHHHGFASVRGRVRAPRSVSRSSNPGKPGESGFGSCSSVISGLPMTANIALDLEDLEEARSEASGNGSVISLMSCQSFAIPENTLRRNDYKRHSMSSLRKFQPNNLSQRNSGSRRSAIIPRYNPKMSAIEEHRPDQGTPPDPLFFEVPGLISKRVFVGRKWLFREMLETLSSDLPTSGGIVIHGDPGTGKTSVILAMVRSSCFGQRISPSMSSTMDILAREVVAYHFCQMDNEDTCSIPHFVHSLAAQMTRSVTLEPFRRFGNPDLLSKDSCLKDPSRVLIKGILEPLAVLRTQGRIPNQRCLILIDGLCEAEFHRNDNGETLGSFLAQHLALLPKWIRIVCTVRTSLVDIVQMFPYHRLTLDNNMDERIFKDLSDYVSIRVRDSQIQRNIVPRSNPNLEEDPQQSLVNFMVHSSGGSFLYVEKVLDLFQTGRLQVKSSSFSFIPVSLSEIYLLEFNLMFPTMESFSKVKDILSICLASLRPMTVKDIFQAFNSLRDDRFIAWDEFLIRFDIISRVLPQRADETRMFCHSTIRDWLIGRRSIDSNKFIVNPRDGHAALALNLTRNLSPLGPEQTLVLGHHLLKANIFRRQGKVDPDISAKDLQSAWIAMSSKDTSAALSCSTNLSSPNLKVSRLLLLAGASPDTLADVGTKESLMSHFSSVGNIEMINLLAEFGANCNLANLQGTTPLMAACSQGNLGIVKQLVFAGSSLNLTDSQGSTCLVYAVRGGHVGVVSLLLSFPWPESGGCSLSQTSQEAFVLACALGHVPMVELLHRHRGQLIRVNVPCDLTGETPLCGAAKGGKVEICEWLIRNGADVCLANRKGSSPLPLAITEGHYSVVETLLGARPELLGTVCDKMGRSPLCVASSEGQVGLVELLISKGADLEWKNQVDGDGITPLGWAVLGAKHNTVDLLLKSNARLDTKDNNQRTVFHHCALIGNLGILDILLNHCPPEDVPKFIEDADKDGIRPVDRAIGHNHDKIVSRLLKKGAKLGPTTWAMAKGKPKISLILFNKLLEDGNTLFRGGRLEEAAYRYEYALKRLPRLKDEDSEEEDVFVQLKSHFLLNLSRTRRKQKRYQEAVELSSSVVRFKPNCFEAYWARGKAKREIGTQESLWSCLSDLREAIKLAPQNLELHRFALKVKKELEQVEVEVEEEKTDKIKDII